MDDKHARLRCETTPLANGDSAFVFLSTVGLVAFTILLEWVSHGSIDCCTTISDDTNADDDFADTTSNELPLVVEQQPDSQPAPEVEGSQNNANEQGPELAKPKKPLPDLCCMSSVSPNMRANRFITAIFLYAVVLTFFVMRMRDISVPRLRSECRPYTSLYRVKSRMPEPNWWIVALLNILPFICASFSFLRTLVDCVLVRWGQGLGYGEQKKGSSWTWPPCMPIFIVWFALFMAVKVLLAFPIACMMGRPLSSTWAHTIPGTDARRAGDIEMEGEETRRLVDDVDGESEGDEERLDGPPAYNEAVHQKECGVKGDAAAT